MQQWHARRATAQANGNRQHSTTNSLLAENSASLATRRTSRMTSSTWMQLWHARRAIAQANGNQQHSITSSLQAKNSASLATRRTSRMTSYTRRQRRHARRATAQANGNRQHSTMTAISGSTVIIRQAARLAIPIQAIINSIPAITATNIPRQIWPKYIVKRASPTIRTVSDATAAEAEKAKEVTIKS